MTWDKLKDKLENKKESATSLPDFWQPEEEEKLVGKVVRKRQSNYNEDNYLYHVKNPDTGKVRTTPEHVTLTSGLKQQNVKVGDYVMIEFQGTERSQKSGRDVYMYDVGVVKEKDAKEVLGEETISKDEPEDDDYGKIKEVVEFFDGDVEEEEFRDLCETKGIENPTDKEYVDVEDGNVVIE